MSFLPLFHIHAHICRFPLANFSKTAKCNTKYYVPQNCGQYSIHDMSFSPTPPGGYFQILEWGVELLWGPFHLS